MPKWRGSVTGYPFLRMTENSGPASRTANYCAARAVCAMCSEHSTAILNSSRTSPAEHKVASFAVVVVRSRSNRIKDLSPQISDILHAAIEFLPGQVMTVGAQVFGGSRPVPIGGHCEMTCGYQSFATYGKFMTKLFDTAVKIPSMKIFPHCAICYCLFGVVSLPVYSAEQAIKLIVIEGCDKQWEDQGRLATTFPFSMM
jgi:hypothetical protein